MKTMMRPLLYLLFLGSAACSKGGGGGQSNTSSSGPTVRVSDVTQGRQTQASTFRFYIDLSAASTQIVTVSYATADGTAKAGVDYTAMNGSIAIAAGQTEV